MHWTCKKENGKMNWIVGEVKKEDKWEEKGNLCQKIREREGGSFC